MQEISESVNRKFVDVIDVDEWEILTPTGWSNINRVMKTVKYRRYELLLENGMTLDGADQHIVMTVNGQKFMEDLRPGDMVMTRSGISSVIRCIDAGYSEHMYDVEVGDDDHLYYSNDIVSHNTIVTASYLLHTVLFNNKYTVAVLANKAAQSQEILDRIKDMYEFLPWFLQPGVKEWNKKSILLGNGSKVFSAGTTASAVRGKSINLVYMDEFAFVENAEEFYTGTYPVISSGNTTKIIITSTPNGMNMFYKLWMEAIGGSSGFKALRVEWHEHPKRDRVWYETTKANIPPRQFAQEYEMAFHGSGDTLLSGEALSSFIAKKPKKEGDWLILEKAKKGRAYVATVDTAEGVGGDYSVISMFDVTEFPYKPIAMYRSNTIHPLAFAQITVNAATKYNEAVLVIENNNSSGGIVANEVYTTYEYENILKTKPKNGQTRAGGGKRSVPGVKTSVRTKHIGCSMLKGMIEGGTLVTEFMEAHEEFTTFVADAKDSYSAQVGKHDDIVMTYVLFAWFVGEPYFAQMVDLETMKIIADKIADDNDYMLLAMSDDGTEDFAYHDDYSGY